MAPTSSRGAHNPDTKGASQHASHDSQHIHIPQLAPNNRQIQHTTVLSTPQTRSTNRNGGTSYSADNKNLPPVSQPTPLFERLVTEEVQELKAYARIIENQNRRLAELERVHGDLESRLELESRGRVQLERTLEEREREWAIKFKTLETDRDHWQGVVKVEQTKNARLIDQVVRKDQDIHRMLQRKVSTSIDFRCLQPFMNTLNPFLIPLV